VRANEKLAARTAIAEYRVTQLQEAVKIETKKRRRGKRLNLIGQEATSVCQWFGVPEVQAAKAYMA
jgi:hypothetical protein